MDERRKGTGLGLHIVRGLVEELRGKIRAISGDGEPGTRFEIRLPRADDADAQTADDLTDDAQDAERRLTESEPTEQESPT